MYHHYWTPQPTLYYRVSSPRCSSGSKQKWRLIVICGVIAILILCGANYLAKTPQVKTKDRYSPKFDRNCIFEEGEIPFDAEVWQMFKDQNPSTTGDRQARATPRRLRPPTPTRRRFIPTKALRKRLSKKQKKVILAQQRYKCEICGKQLQEWDHEMDHRIPLSMANRGIRPEILNHPSNYRALCRACHGFQTMKQRKAGLFKRARD